MKLHLIMVAILALSAISCSKVHEEARPKIIVKEYLQGKVDGIFFSDSREYSVDVPGPQCRTCSNDGPLRDFTIQGKSHLGLVIVFFPIWPVTGETMLAYPSAYRVTITDGIQQFFAGKGYAHVTGADIWQGSGKITIVQSTSGSIKGTFECIAPTDSTLGIFPPPISITEGVFSRVTQH